MLEYEKIYCKDYKLIAGCDEAGRGCCAGPLVVASVIMDPNYKNDEINDSKKLSESKRNMLFEEIKKNALGFSIAILDNKKVDDINPKQASKFGMYTCIKQLPLKPDLIITDYEKIEGIDIPQINLVKGDSLSFNVACASILAKVTRDRKMLEYDKIYPKYGFKKHKGYCTKDHTAALLKYGISPIHRLSYKNVKIALDLHNNNNVEQFKED
ncbi:ribonuclease HII [Mycoplasmopsis felifaucium]|uniref:Ribonuclease HII n=1 Tax=Mycoplasmopsis felifaucium TaxID=35768 RepID=A0ABZ2RTY4_9BACT